MLYDVTIHSERCHTNSIESCFGSGPLVPKQAHIHPHPPPSSPPYQRQAGKRGRRKIDAIDVKRGAGGRSGGEMREGGQARLGERQGRVIVHVPPLTSEEKLQANTAIEKQRSKERLEQWREEARLDHLKPLSGGSTASDTAPYATDRQHSPTAKAGQDLTLASPLSDHGEVARKRVEHYNTALQTQRRQAGLISDASSDLLEAERRLAEALAQRDEMEEKKKRAYRLTAFTADPYLL
ncbi:hypothetical protein GBAR_LOCUS10568 [Geodia barretti]|uniref:Uncharacterized protein n=1 Tax=Geodia barretti TaxID=519541 RepID=A0AA35RVX4_GEOBA|nr:hypothetical protein GBAR_LOCUS10568 [Geodia barretti]